MVDLHLLSQIPVEIGLFTGRNVKELDLVKGKIGFQYFRKDCIACDDGRMPRKPNPEPLFDMVKRCGSRGLVYVGDTFDDYKTMLNFQHLYPEVRAGFVQVLGGKQPFSSEISIVENVDRFLRLFESV